MLRFRSALLCVAVLLAACAGFPVAAAESNLVTTGHDTASLVSENDGFVPGQALIVGLRLRLAPGWHSYWSNPGDAGEAPTISVTATGAASGTAGTIDWPAPLRLPDGPLMSYGYTGDLVLPLVLHLAPGSGQTAGKDGLHLSATADWLACANVCVPEHGTFRLDLPRQTQGAQAAPSPQAPLFAIAQNRRPVPSPFPAMLGPDGVLSLSGNGLGPQSVRNAWFFPASAGVIDQVAAQKVSVTPGRIAIALKTIGPTKPGNRLEGLVVLRDKAGNESFLAVHAAAGTRSDAPFAPSASGGWSALPRLLLLALLGGMVLNLMPCVFPVLAMKALALSRMSGAGRREMRLSAAFYTAGVLLAFGALGALMLGLRAAGSVLEWGFQFQSAAFVAGICWLLFALGLNLAGLFEIGGGMAGLGQGLIDRGLVDRGPATRGSHAGDFFTGLLAVLVATPCTAPFMGVAVAGALAASPAVGIAVFLAMGLGLALPYALVALSPGLARRLPRPGAWMALLRQALSFPLFASCAWLAWVTAREGGDAAVLVLASGMVLLALAGWLLGLSQREARRPLAWIGAAALCAAAALAMLPTLSDAHPEPGRTDAGTEAFSDTRLAALRAEGRPVFVDMTAAWCVTCLLNEQVALAPERVRQAFAAHHVAYLKGDWTSRNREITDFLRAHGRDGVPLYVYYPAGAEGRVLPQILSAGRVLHEIGGQS
jgi:thiol:disulfide interchange protein/DsbC/DsbD-like thiol-disulfide interchange protein